MGISLEDRSLAHGLQSWIENWMEGTILIPSHLRRYLYEEIASMEMYPAMRQFFGKE